MEKSLGNGAELRLRTGQTVRIGFVFLSICAFWQMYNNVIPLMLTNTFHMNETFSGAIMAADNVLGLFLLPLFGGLSDRCQSRMGRRKPFILCGTVAAVFLMLLLPFLDNRFFANPTTAGQAVFVCVLGCLLVAMGTYRSPAVALMPDVTPKPLRSKGNAIINLMGAVGGIAYLIVASVLYSASRTAGMEHVDYMPLFLVVAGIMIVSLIVVMTTVNEVKLRAEMAAFEAAQSKEAEADGGETARGGDNVSGGETARSGEIVSGEETSRGGDSVRNGETSRGGLGAAGMPPSVKRSLIFLLLSIALWFVGYNAVETWFTTYAVREWGMSLGGASLCLTIATGGAILSYIPVGQIAGRIGRKRTIIIGVLLLGGCFAFFAAYSFAVHAFHPGLYAGFVLVGFAWAAINVNSLPMVLELCSEGEIGRFTGYYYTFSMAAQTVTPIVAGALLSSVGYGSLFPYAAAFVFLSFATMCAVRHGDSRLA